MTSLMTLPRLAFVLRLPRKWLRQEAVAGRLPYLRVGKKLLFNLKAVQESLAERAAAARSARPEA